MTTPYSIPLTPPGRGQQASGLGNPQDKEIRQQRPRTPNQKFAPYIRGQGGCPISSHPGAPPHTVSISKGNWCYMLVLLFRGGREEGRVSQGTLPSLNPSIKMVHTFVGQSHLSLSTRSHPWLHPIGTQMPRALTLDLMTRSLSLWIPWPCLPLPVAISHIWDTLESEGSHTGNSPPCSCGIHPPTHSSIHPSVHPNCLVPLADWAHPLSTWFTCHGSLYPVFSTPATHPKCWPGVQGVVRAGAGLSSPHAVLYPPSLPGATLLQSMPHHPTSLCFAVIDQ